MPIHQVFKAIYSVCDDCVANRALMLSDYLKRLADALPNTRCDYCDKLNTDTPSVRLNHKEHQANNVAKFIESHGIDAHVTLTGMIRARYVYTYRDENEMLCQDYEWVYLDPTQTDTIYELLGY